MRDRARMKDSETKRRTGARQTRSPAQWRRSGSPERASGTGSAASVGRAAAPQRAGLLRAPAPGNHRTCGATTAGGTRGESPGASQRPGCSGRAGGCGRRSSSSRLIRSGLCPQRMARVPLGSRPQNEAQAGVGSQSKRAGSPELSGILEVVAPRLQCRSSRTIPQLLCLVPLEEQTEPLSPYTMETAGTCCCASCQR